MINISGLVAMFVSAFLIAIADGLIKGTSVQGNFVRALFNPWMLVILGFYFLQILIAIYIFTQQGELAIYGNLFIVFYSIMMTAGGIYFFHEQISSLQILGIILALLGAVLMNS